MAKRKKKLGQRPNLGTVFTRIGEEAGQGHSTRKHLYVRLERLIGMPVIACFTSFRWPVSLEDTDAEMVEDLLRAGDYSRGLALIISSPGGDGEAAERIVNLCRAHTGRRGYWAIVPGKAKSAATMVCFGASTIAMGPSSELGPVDPQIIFWEEDKRRQYSAHNLVMSYDALFDEAVKTTGHIEPYIQQLDHYDARDIKRYREAIALADDIAVKILQSGMMKRFRNEAVLKRKIRRFLQPDETKSHGRPIFREEARKSGLNVRNADKGSERWDITYELYMRVNHLVSGFAATKCIESANDSFIVPVPRSWTN